MWLQGRALCTDLLQPYTDFLNLQQSLGRFASTTQSRCIRAARMFLATYPHLSPERITSEHIERFLVAQPLSTRSMQTEFMRLRVFFRWLTDDYRLLKTNPCDRVHKPRWHAVPRPAPSEAEIVVLCRACQGLEEIVLVEVLYHTGLRVRELRNLRGADVDLARRLLRVVGKGGRPYDLPFPPRVADLLGAWLDGSGWVFRGPRGARRRVEWIEGVLHRLGRAVGLPYTLTAHLLRHGLARTLKTTEMPLAAIQQVLRHQSIQTTINLYGRLQLEDVRALYDKHMAGRA